MPNRKAIVDILIVVMTAAAFVVGMCAVREGSYQAGFTVAKNLVENSSLGAVFRTPDDIRTLVGTVTAVNSDSITLRTTSNNPFDNPSLTNRTILIASSTKITKFILKDPTVFQSELAAYTKAGQSGSAAKDTQPPVPFTLTAITLADIKVGDSVLVTAPTNIKLMKTFTASSIQDQPPPPPAGS